MNPTRAFIRIALVSVLAVSCTAQPSPTTSKLPASATLEGVVTKDPGSEPVKKAVIELIAEDQKQAGNYTALSATDGTFRIEGVVPGRYHLFAERTGYVESTKHGGRSVGSILTVAAGQDLKDLHIRFAAAATVSLIKICMCLLPQTGV